MTVDPRRSLAVTEQAILNDTSVDPTTPGLPAFTLPAVLGQLAGQMGTGQTADTLFRQLWDTANPAPGISGLSGPHCDDNGHTVNGFQYDCRSAEGSQAAIGAIVNINSYMPIGLFNRFDLAPADGSNCGEYRIIFAKDPQSPAFGNNRNFIIFEAVLPNPTPSLGLEGCRAVENFWSSLTSNNVVSSRALALRKFYFLGLTGFSPVFHVGNYGNNPTSSGQIRVNQFLQFDWMLREFKLHPILCPNAPVCPFQFFPVTDKTNPFPDLFNPTSPQPLAPEFQNTFFPSQVASLAVNDINTFNYTVTDKFNTGQSDSQVDNYNVKFGTGASAFRTNIQNQLTAIGSTLTPDDVVRRAEALSCAGCHQVSNGASLGGSLTWPTKSIAFVHVAENQTEVGPDGVRFFISEALTNVFLPHRKAVLEDFLNTPANNAQFISQSVPTVVQTGQVFTVSLTFKNTGTATWTEANSFRLGSQNPQDNTTWGLNRAKLAPSDSILRGQSKTFTFSVTAPAAAGTYGFQWRMIRDSTTITGSFGDFSTNVNIQVVAPSSGI